MIGCAGVGIGTLAPAFFAAGCGGSGPRIIRESFQGPNLTIESAGSTHKVILAAPSSGWNLTLNAVRPGFERADVFITITRPDPAYMHAQSIVMQHLDTGVANSTEIHLFARELEYGQPAGGGYREVEKAVEEK